MTLSVSKNQLLWVHMEYMYSAGYMYADTLNVHPLHDLLTYKCPLVNAYADC